jgi:hypothetical protein
MFPGDFSAVAPAAKSAAATKQRVVDHLKFCLKNVGRGQWQRLSLLLPEGSGPPERGLAAYRPPQVTFAPMRFVSYDCLAEAASDDGEGHPPGDARGGGSATRSGGTTPRRPARPHSGSLG